MSFYGICEIGLLAIPLFLTALLAVWFFIGVFLQLLWGQNLVHKWYRKKITIHDYCPCVHSGQYLISWVDQKVPYRLKFKYHSGYEGSRGWISEDEKYSTIYPVPWYINYVLKVEERNIKRETYLASMREIEVKKLDC